MSLAVSDPLYPAAAAMADPEPLAEVVEALGGASASSAVHTGSVTPIDEPDIGGTGEGGCVTALQDALAFGLDAMIADPTVDLVEVDNLTQWYSQSNFACCLPRTWNNWWVGPWVCTGSSAWTYSHSQPLLNGPAQDCIYRRTVSRERRRTVVRRCFNCDTVAQHQVEIESGLQEYAGHRIQAGMTCPPAPSWGTSITCEAGPDPALGSYNSTGWQPPLNIQCP